MTEFRRFLLLGAMVAVAALFPAEPGEDVFERVFRERILDPPAGVPVERPTYATDQAALASQFASEEFRRRYPRHALREGEPFARLRIPSLGVDLIVIHGVSGDALRAGAGHYPSTAFPGTGGNVAIAGHRTGFGSPFLHLDYLMRGDTAELETPEGRFVYAVSAPFDDHTNPWVTHPLDWTTIAPTKTEALTITTAHPPRTAKNRLVVRLQLVPGSPG